MDCRERIAAQFTRLEHQPHLGQLQAVLHVGQVVEGIGFFSLGIEHVQPVFAADLVLPQIRLHHLGSALQQHVRGLQLISHRIEFGQGGLQLRLNIELDGADLRAHGLQPSEVQDAYALVRAIEGVAREARALQLRMLDEVERSGVHQADGHRTAGILVRHAANLSKAEAKRRAKVVRMLRSMPLVAAGFAIGRIGACQVDRIGGQGAHGLGVHHVGLQAGGQTTEQGIGLRCRGEGDVHRAQFQPIRVVAHLAPQRVGQQLVAALVAQDVPCVVVEQRRERVETLRAAGLQAVAGDAAEPETLVQAHIHQARLLVVTVPDATDTYAMIRTAHALRPELTVLSRAPNEAEAALLVEAGVAQAVQPRQAMAQVLLQHTLAQWAKGA